MKSICNVICIILENICIPVGHILISVFDLDLAITLQFWVVHDVVHIFSHSLNLRRTLGTCQQI